LFCIETPTTYEKRGLLRKQAMDLPAGFNGALTWASAAHPGSTPGGWRRAFRCNPLTYNTLSKTLLPHGYHFRTGYLWGR
jgi:hypothetical protein